MAEIGICEHVSANVSLAVGTKLQVAFITLALWFKIETSCTTWSQSEISTNLWAGNMK
jgi:uncharacterized membrane protein